MTVDQLRPRGGHHVQRVVAGPLQKVFDELEQRGVRPLHVLEHEHGRLQVREPLEEQPPGAEEVLALLSDPLFERQQLRQAGLHPAALVGIRDELAQAGLQLRERGRRILRLGDARTHPDHLGERPVRHAFAVCEAPAAVCVYTLGDPVDVLVEFPAQPGFADPGDANHGDEVSLALLGAGVEQILDETQLPVPADERRLEPFRFLRASDHCHDAERAPQPHRFRLAPQRMLAGVRIHDSRLGCAPGGLADEHRSGRRLGLDPGGGVDEVTRHHPLRVGPEGDRGGPAEHAGSGLQCRLPDLASEDGDRLDQLHGRTHRALGIVLMG